MKTGSRMTHLDKRTRAVRGKHAKAPQRTELPRIAAHRLPAMALLLSLGMGAVATSGYAISQVSGHDGTSAGQVINIPWMY
jgi:cytochrome b561